MANNYSVEKPILTVLMPVYNGGVYLAEAIRSILAQSLRNFELLIINDGSTDDSHNVAESFNDPRIRVINLKSNSGLVNALNIGLQEAKGDFLARMDHDDIAHPLRFQKQIDAMIVHGTVVCGSAIQPFGAITGDPIVYPVDDAEIRATLPVAPTFAHPAVMMRTELCRSLKYDSTALHYEDYDLWWRISKCGKMQNLPEPLLKYRFHPSQISSKNNHKQLIGVASIASKELLNDGRYRSEMDFELHRKAITFAKLESIDELECIGEWLSWLRKSYGVDTRTVANQYDRVWLGLCSRQPHLGRGMWSVYKRNISQDTLKERVMLLLTSHAGLSVDNQKIKAIRRMIRR